MFLVLKLCLTSNLFARYFFFSMNYNKDARKRWWYEVKHVIALAYNKLIKFSSLWRQIIWFFTIIAFGSGFGSGSLLLDAQYLLNAKWRTFYSLMRYGEAIVMARECGLNGNWTNEGNTGELTKFNRLYYFLVCCCCLWSLDSIASSSSSISLIFS